MRRETILADPCQYICIIRANARASMRKGAMKPDAMKPDAMRLGVMKPGAMEAAR
jgi:hypothetical protein